jgi:GAF domain-containing protein
MRRRDKPGGKAAKTQRPKTLKRRNAPKSGRRRNPSAIDATERIELLTRERAEALEREAATAEVLKLISRSTFDLKAVLEILVQSAGKLCQAENVQIFLRDGEFYRLAADNGFSPEYQQYVREHPIRPGRGTLVARTALAVVPVQIPDRLADSEYTYHEGGNLGGYRTMLGVPLVRDGSCIGVIALTRSKVRPFTDKQIELVKNFAAQAVIAIENTRLLNELRQRTDDLSESLEQQTATSEVLKVISSSAGTLEPVFNAMLENATRICEAKFGNLWLREGEDGFRSVAVNGESFYAEWSRQEPVVYLRDHPGAPLDRVHKTGKVVHIPDLRLDNSYRKGDPRLVALADTAGARSQIVVPMLKDGELIGAIVIYRTEVRPFSDKQIELLRNFAAQAVIAIENARLLNELRESLQQQTATADVLKVISSSPGELAPVFQAMLENAVRICEASFGVLFRNEDGAMRAAAMVGVPPAFAEFWQRGPQRPGPRTAFGRVSETKQTIHIADVKAEPAYVDGEPVFVAAVNLGNFRTLLNVPMLKENELIGVLAIYRQEVRPFTDKQIELLQNFAAQAVIAIENTRLLSELRQRTNDLSESLEQQTATSEVLKVISSSAGELQPVFETMLAKAVELCEASFGAMWLVEGEGYRTAALHGDLPEAYVEQWRSGTLHRPKADVPMVRAIRSREPVHVTDMLKDTAYLEGDPLPVSVVEIAGIRTLLTVPMLKEGEAVGVITIYRKEVRAFSDKQIELLKNFAAQAVIAIENTRLLSELRESLQQQTATADVLKVISSSPGELEPVFQAMLANAVRICEAKFGVLFRYSGDVFRAAAWLGVPPAYEESLRHRGSFQADAGAPLHRLMKTKALVQTADELAEPNPGPAAKFGGARSLIAVPMLKEDELVGAFVIYRTEVRPFTDKQIELVTNFANQAVIAIENTRLLKELRQRTDDLSESLDQQTATSEVLKVISSSPGELAPVFEAILGNATRICEAKFGTLTQVVDGIPRLMFQLGVPAPLEEYWRRETPRPSPHNAISRVITTGQAVHVTDLQAYQAYIDGDPLAVAGVELGGIRTLLVVPMLKDDKTFGTIGIYRQEVHPFTDKQIELVSNFAAQAAIAIENTRLLNELRQRTDDLSKSLEDLRTTQDRLVQTQKLASLGQLTAGIAHEIKNPLNFVNNFSGVSVELIDELQEALKDVSLNEKRRSEISELMDTLRGNLDKVVQHGKRADAIVKNMLLHSREGSGEHRVVDINTLVEESLNLAYHGARAEKQGFNIIMERSLNPDTGQADVFPQDITRVLLNLISNGFYAATKRRAEASGDGYEPTLVASTRSLGDRVEIRVRDNGTGIPPEVKEKMFNPFFTTKPAGEGTGLGLSICHDIIVKQHGGSIEVDTKHGEFTEIRVTLPRVVALLPERP